LSTWVADIGSSDNRAERHLKNLQQKFVQIGKEGKQCGPDWLRVSYHLLCVEIWMVEINGRPSSYFYTVPSGARVPTVTTFYKKLDKWIPKQMELCTDILIACLEYREDSLQPRWAVAYCDRSNQWYQKVIMHDVLSKQPWKDRTVSIPYQGYQVRPEIQKWSKEGYLRALSANRIDPQIPSVPQSYLRYFGRDEAWD
jgi:hypothetical protein